MIDWTRYANVESKRDVMSGVFVVRGTRVLQAVVDNKTGIPPADRGQISIFRERTG